HIPHGDLCATNQVPYNIGDRAIERDLLPWCEQHGMPVMAYSPLGGLGANLLRDSTLAQIGEAHGCSAATVALPCTIRSGTVIAMTESGLAAHVKENAVALALTLISQELRHWMQRIHRPASCRFTALRCPFATGNVRLALLSVSAAISPGWIPTPC